MLKNREIYLKIITKFKCETVKSFILKYFSILLDVLSKIKMSKNKSPVKKQPKKSKEEDGVWGFEHEWSRGLCDCCANYKQFCFLVFCPCCFVSFLN